MKLPTICQLPPAEQDAVAALMLDELASEKRWDEAFAKTQDALSSLAKEALAAYSAGKTTPLNRDSYFPRD